VPLNFEEISINYIKIGYTLLMHCWCTFDALLNSMHFWCTFTTFWCTFDALLKSASKVHHKCIKNASKFYKNFVWKVTIFDQKKSMQSVSSKVHWMQSQIRFVECSQKARRKCIESASKIDQKCIRNLGDFLWIRKKTLYTDVLVRSH
jgi:hypothetical protein